MKYHLPAILLASLVLSGSCRQEETSTLPPPNILIAIADDWSWPHAGAYGDPVVQTPAFDRVSQEGILFTNAYVSAPSCTPSRAAILTGQFHWRLEESANLWSTLQTKFATYPELLEQGGYFVGFTGKGWGPGRIEPGGRKRNPAGEKFESFASFLAEKPPGTPFCFWYGSLDPHRGYEEGSGKESGIDTDQIQVPACLPDSQLVRSDIADYYVEVQRFDRAVGDLLAELEVLGELDNTLVIVTSDNGMPFPRCKGNVYDMGVRVPLAIRYPTAIQAEGTVDDLVSLTDLAPTLLHFSGQNAPPSMTGRSLEPIFVSEAGRFRDPSRTFVLFGKERHVPCQEAPDSGGTPMRAIRTANYLYIRNFRPDRWPAGTPDVQHAFFPGSWYGDVDNSPTKFYMVDHRNDDGLHRELFRLAFDKRPAEELYDLKKDPQQLQNVASIESYAEIKAALSTELMRQLEQTKDPRLTNPDFLEGFPYYGGSPLKPGYKAAQ